MRHQFLNAPDDLEWLRDVHVSARWQGIASDARSYVITGNEDCPDEITLYASADPLYSESPLCKLKRCEHTGELLQIGGLTRPLPREQMQADRAAGIQRLSASMLTGRTLARNARFALFNGSHYWPALDWDGRFLWGSMVSASPNPFASGEAG